MDDEFFAQFDAPEDTENDWKYYDNDENDEFFLTNHLNREQLTLVDEFIDNGYHRAKRSHKKMNAQRQIKTKHAKSIKFNSHNKHLYMHHRLVKKVILDPPSQNYLSTKSSHQPYSNVKNQQDEKPVAKSSVKPTTTSTVPQDNSQTFLDFTINEHTMQQTADFDDAMIAFLLDMQNRDL